jgi:uncharacterized membrane protein
MQFSQEGELGTRITYELGLERFVDDNKTFSLMVLNLPGDYTYDFRESETGDQRVSRIRFKKGVTVKTIRMSINMPREIDKEQLNQKIQFFVLVLDRFAQQRLASAQEKRQGRTLTRDDLDSAAISFETLELVPRGRAEISISASNLFYKARLGEVIKFTYNLANTGTVNLERIRNELVLPLNWTAATNPEKDIALGVAEKKRVDVEIVPAVDVVAGDYEVKLQSSTMHEGREVQAEDKTLRLQVEAKSNFLIGAILMIALVGMIVGVAVMTIKISRR